MIVFKKIKFSENRVLNYRADIDGLRAIAVMSVVIYHAFPALVPGGFIGVDIFFVISGFLISGIIIKNIQSDSFSIIDFYKRRVKRIFPSLSVMLLTVAIAGYFIMMPADYSVLGKHLISSSLSFQNLMLLSESGYFDSSSELKPLLHLWSLGVEEQFYLLWPVMLIGLCKISKRIIAPILVITTISFIWCYIETSIDQSWAFYAPWFRFWELSIGGVIYLISKKINTKPSVTEFISIFSFSLLFLSIYLINNSIPFPSYVAILPVLSSALIIAFCNGTVISNSLLSNKVFVWIGKISYPLYIWHWPLLSFYFYAYPSSSGQEDTYIRLLLIISSMFLASITYYFIENKIRYTKGIKSTLSVVVLCLFMILMSIYGFVVYKTDGFKDRMSGKISLISGDINFNWKDGVRGGVCHIMDDIDAEKLTNNRNDCVSKNRNQIFLWGDSHAGASYPGVNDLAIRNGLNVSQITGAKRVPFKGSSNIADEQYREAINYIGDIKPLFVFLDARWTVHGKPKDVFPKLENTINEIKERSPETVIYVIGPAPEWHDNLQKILYVMAVHGEYLPKYTKNSMNEWVIKFDREFRSLLSNSGIHYISLIDVMCNDDGCITNINGNPETITAIDYGHLSKYASIFAFSKISIK